MASLQREEYILSDQHLHQLSCLVKGAAPKWKEIGLALGFSMNVLNIIATKPENISVGPSAMFLDLLSRWLKWAPPKHSSPTLEMLANALREDTIGEEKIANDLMQEFRRTPVDDAVGKIPSLQPSMPLPPINPLTPRVSIDLDVTESSSSSTATVHQSAETATKNTSLAITRAGVPSVGDVQTRIHDFEQRFKGLKVSTREGLEWRRVDVKIVVECLTDLPEDDKPDHELFLETYIDKLLQAKSLYDLFVRMNPYWSYLAYHLLEHLIKELSVKEVSGEMERYKSDLQRFMWDTPLEVFRFAQKERVMDIPAGFKELVASFEWPDNVTLAVVEEFRQRYAYHYNLHKCAMMLITIRRGSYIVIWCISESIIKHLMKEVAEDILSEYAVSRLVIDGVCVFNQMPISSGIATDCQPTGAASKHPLIMSTKQEYVFVNPSEDLKRPLTLKMLLKQCVVDSTYQLAHTKYMYIIVRHCYRGFCVI